MRIRFFENVRFCPRCGVEALERDLYKQAPPQPGGGGSKGEKQIRSGTEWLCRLCGFSFRVMESTRWRHADELQRRDRQLRQGKASDNTTPEIRDRHVAHLESGKGANLNRQC